MNTSSSLVTLYNIIYEIAGPIEAKESVSTAVYLVIAAIQEQGLPITSDLIELKLAAYVQDFIEVAEKNKVA